MCIRTRDAELCLLLASLCLAFSADKESIWSASVKQRDARFGALNEGSYMLRETMLCDPWWAGTHLLPQHSGGVGKKVGSSRLSLAT